MQTEHEILFSDRPVFQFAKGHLFFILVVCLSGVAHSALADSEFEEAFLRRDRGGVSPDVFVWHDAIVPGMKSVDVRVNDRLAERMDVRFVSDGNQRVIPCLSREQLLLLGIKINLYDDQKVETEGLPPGCEDTEKRIPSSQLSFDASEQVLNITVPQEAVDRQRYTMISPDEWDNGVPSLRTSYNGYFYSTKTAGASGEGWRTDDTTSRSAWAYFNSTGSLGAWRFYSIDSFYRNAGQGWKSNHDRAYLARDIAMLRSNMQAGEIHTNSSGYMTESVPLRGISLGTRQNMSLENQFNYAPVIRGVARTNARLVVRQRGNIIYSTTLTPGPFAIDDLYAAQVGADLEVSVEESDGQVQVFRVPYTVVPGMIRPGAMRYNIAAGQYRTQDNSVDTPWVSTGNLEYGFEHLTLNGTYLASTDYQSLAAGAAWNIGRIGAFSTEASFAHHDQGNGSAVRFLYARNFESTGTTLQILGYQYRSKNYLGFSEYLSQQNRNKRQASSSVNDSYWNENDANKRRRSRVEMTLNQNMNGRGSLYMSMSQDRFYGSDQKSTSISGGAGTSIGFANVSLSLTRVQTNDSNKADNQISLSINLPLGSNRSLGSLNYGLTRDRDNRYSQNLGYSGNALDNRLSYSTSVMRDAQSNYSQSGSLGYSSSIGSFSGGLGHSRDYTQYSAGMSGGITLYGGGVVLSPQLSNTIAIVETPGASGIGVSGAGGAQTDYFGHAIVTTLTPYRYNDIGLDISRSSDADNVELKETSRRVVPSEGAAVRLRFAVRAGRRAMVDIGGDKNIPLGAMVYIDGEKEEAGIVGNHRQAYLSGLDARREQRLNVVWGSNASERCSFTLPALPEGKQSPDEWYKKVSVTCR